MARDHRLSTQPASPDGIAHADHALSGQFTLAHVLPGRLRLKLRPPHSPARLEAGRAALAQAVGVRAVRINQAAWSLVVEYDAARTDPALLLSAGTIDGGMPAGTPPTFREQMEVEVALPVPRGRVWRIVSDPRHIPLYVPATVHVDGGVDADQWTVEMELLGRRVRQRLRVVERAPEQRLVLTLVGGVQARITVTLEDQGRQTRLCERLEYTLPGSFLRQLVDTVVVRPRLHEQLREHLERLSATVRDESMTSGC